MNKPEQVNVVDAPQSGSNSASLWFEPFAADVMGPALDRVRASVAVLSEVRMAADWREWLSVDLRQVMDEMLAPSCVAELWRLQKEGRLRGATGTERFSDFLSFGADRDYLESLWARRPVLLDLLARAAWCWAENMTEMLSRLESDWDAVRVGLLHGAGGTLTGYARKGDYHNRNRAVAVLEFSNGQRAVYKPRDLGPERIYQAWVRHVEQFGGLAPLRTQLMIPRRGYGWCEYVEHRPCADVGEVSSYYVRLGAHLALLYGLQASDMHQENLIACGADPVLVDLEALAHPTLPRPANQAPPSGPEGEILSSVQRVGLLPEYRYAGDGQEGMQLGGIMQRDGQLSALALRIWEDPGTDRMRLVRRRVPVGPAKNVPSLCGKGPVCPIDFLGDLRRGFEQAYRAMLGCRDRLLGAEGPFAELLKIRSRILFRDTDFYAQVLQESYHPTALTDATARNRMVFDHLEQPPVWFRPLAVVRAERRALWRGDVPCFFAEVATGTVWDGDGMMRLAQLPQSGAEAVRACLTVLGEDDLRRQLWFIDASFVVAGAENAVGSLDRRSRLLLSSTPGTLPKEPGDPLTIAVGVGELLLTTASASPAGDLRWVTLLPRAAGGLFVADSGPSLFHGTSGIAMFFACLHAATGDAGYRQSLDRCWTHTVREATSHLSERGLADGWGGLAYAASVLTRLTRDDRFVALPLALVSESRLPKAGTEPMDLLSGVAGELIGALCLRAVVPDSRLDSMADQRAGVLETAFRSGGFTRHGIGHGAEGVAWALGRFAESRNDQSGVAWAIGELDSALDRRAAPTAAGQLLAAEPDALTSNETTAEARARGWCYGNAGLALARFDLEPVATGASSAAARIAVDEANPPMTLLESDCLCHGDLGVQSLLTLVGKYCEREGRPFDWSWRQAQFLDRITRRGVVCGSAVRISVPGLMLGLAGVGIALVRQAMPHLDLPDPLRLA